MLLTAPHTKTSTSNLFSSQFNANYLRLNEHFLHQNLMKLRYEIAKYPINNHQFHKNPPLNLLLLV